MTAVLRQLPLHPLHREAHAHFGVFGEWEVPLYFSSILEEHETVRTRAGLFDISHMGEFFLWGRAAKPFLDYLLPRRMSRLASHKALYTPLLNPSGGIVDDLIVYQIDPERFLLIVNASTIEKDFHWIQHCLPTGVHLENASERKGLFALQGPRSLEIAASLFDCDFKGLGYYYFLSSRGPWGELLISRTGYTGEEGLEILVEVAEAGPLWQSLKEAGKRHGLLPAGFGARDTLRLEAGMPLYGQDMDDSTSAVEAGLEWAVDFEKDTFVGRERNLLEKEKGVVRKRIYFEMVERGIPRPHFEIQKKGRAIGRVTSGSFAPTLRKNVGMGYVAFEASHVGDEIEILIRNQNVKARIVEGPFYRRKQNGISK